MKQVASLLLASVFALIPAVSGYAVPYESPTTTPTKTADGYYDITPSGGGIELRYEVIQESVDGNEGKLAVIAKNYAQDVPAYGIMGSLYIPAGFEWTENSEQKKYAVTKISSRAFWKCVITHVTFADDSKVDTIDSYAFYECMGLSKISLENTGEGVFPTSLKAIGAHAFVGTKLGGDINISGSIEHIGPAFQGTQISSLLIRKQEGGALEILADAFADCGSLTLVGIEAVGGTSVSIKSGAFVRSAPNGNGVSSSLTLFDVSVEEGAFTGSNFTQLVFEGHKDVAIAVKAGTFSGLSKVVSADFAGNILFKVNALSGLVNVRNINFSDGEAGSKQIKLEKNALTGLPALEEVRFFHTDTHQGTFSIEEGAFTNLPKLRKLTFDGEGVIGKKAFSAINKLSKIDFGDNVDISIGEEAFANLSELKDITFKGVVSVGKNAFVGSALSEVVFEDAAFLLKENAFSGLGSLNTVSFGGKGTIEKEVFTGDDKLLKIVFNTTNITIDSDAFKGLQNTTEKHCTLFFPYVDLKEGNGKAKSTGWQWLEPTYWISINPADKNIEISGAGSKTIRYKLWKWDGREVDLATVGNSTYHATAISIDESFLVEPSEYNINGTEGTVKITAKPGVLGNASYAIGYDAAASDVMTEGHGARPDTFSLLAKPIMSVFFKVGNGAYSSDTTLTFRTGEELNVTAVLSPLSSGTPDNNARFATVAWTNSAGSALDITADGSTTDYNYKIKVPADLAGKTGTYTLTYVSDPLVNTATLHFEVAPDTVVTSITAFVSEGNKPADANAIYTHNTITLRAAVTITPTPTSGVETLSWIFPTGFKDKFAVEGTGETITLKPKVYVTTDEDFIVKTSYAKTLGGTEVADYTFTLKPPVANTPREIAVGETLTLADEIPSGVSGPITWQSSNSALLSVTPDKKVHAKLVLDNNTIRTGMVDVIALSGSAPIVTIQFKVVEPNWTFEVKWPMGGQTVSQDDEVLSIPYGVSANLLLKLKGIALKEKDDSTALIGGIAWVDEVSGEGPAVLEANGLTAKVTGLRPASATVVTPISVQVANKALQFDVEVIKPTLTIAKALLDTVFLNQDKVLTVTDILANGSLMDAGFLPELDWVIVGDGLERVSATNIGNTSVKIKGKKVGTHRLNIYHEGDSIGTIMVTVPNPKVTFTPVKGDVSYDAAHYDSEECVVHDTVKISEAVTLSLSVITDGQEDENPGLTWTSDNPAAIGFGSEATVTVTGVSVALSILSAPVEDVKISAKYGASSDVVDFFIHVIPPTVQISADEDKDSVRVGDTLRLTASVAYPGNSPQITPIPLTGWTWTSDHPDTVSVVPLVAGKNDSIEIGVKGGFAASDTVTITVISPIGGQVTFRVWVPRPTLSIEPQIPAGIKIGETLDLQAALAYGDGDVLEGYPVIWESADSTQAIVNSEGVVTGVSGTAAEGVDIIASSAGASDTVKIVVESPKLSISDGGEDAQSGNLHLGTPKTFSLFVYYGENIITGVGIDVLPESVGDSSFFSSVVEKTTGENAGVGHYDLTVTPKYVGAAGLKVSVGGHLDSSIVLTVIPPDLTIAPEATFGDTIELAAAKTLSLSVTASYDGVPISDEWLTNAVWTSDAPLIVKVDSVSGLLLARRNGTAQVTVELAGVSAVRKVTVPTPSLEVTVYADTNVVHSSSPLQLQASVVLNGEIIDTAAIGDEIITADLKTIWDVDDAEKGEPLPVLVNEEGLVNVKSGRPVGDAAKIIAKVQAYGIEATDTFMVYVAAYPLGINAVPAVSAHSVTLHTDGLYLRGFTDTDAVTVYTIDGRVVLRTRVAADYVAYPFRPRTIYIVRTPQTSFKLVPQER